MGGFILVAGEVDSFKRFCEELKNKIFRPMADGLPCGRQLKETIKEVVEEKMSVSKDCS